MAQDQQTDSGATRVLIGLVAIFAVYGTMAYFVQTMNTARPKIAADLNGMSLYAWSVTIPSLVSAFVTLVFGKLSDMYGRRIMLMLSVIFCTIGTILSAISTSFEFLIGAQVVAALGTGAMMPLVFAVVGDMFPPEKRGKWIGLLNIPTGIFAIIGPTLGGWFVDNLTWRYLFWVSMPLLIVCLITVPIGVPSIVTAGGKRKIDVLGCILVAIASSTTILGLSYAGDKYPWGSYQILGLLGIALLSWIAFFRAEARAEEPVMDPVVLRNRSFLTVAIATFFSFFGQMSIMMYLPVFLQGVQDVTATRSGQIITPYSVLMAFIGVPVGFMLARSPRFKWMYILGFGIVTMGMFSLVLFTQHTPPAWSVAVAVVAGFGLGAIPTVNTMVVQNSVPQQYLGAAMGAMFFCILMGVAISPALLGSAMNATYTKTLAANLPPDLNAVADPSTIASLKDSGVLLDSEKRESLKKTFEGKGSHGIAVYNRTIEAVRTALEAGLRSVFWIGAVTMLIAFLIICTVPTTTIRSIAKEDVSQPAVKAKVAAAENTSV